MSTAAPPEKRAKMAKEEEKERPLPAGWVKKMSRSKGQEYYFAPATGQSVWERPTKPVVAAPSGGPVEVRCLHILKKHTGSRNPKNWKKETITRSKEEACSLIEALRVKVVDAGADFGKLAGEESDCSSAKRGGDLGTFERKQMQRKSSVHDLVKPMEEIEMQIILLTS